MKRYVVALSLVLITVGNAFAETYPNVVYSGGHPELQTEKIKGSLSVLADRVEFTTEDSQGGIKIPYDAVQKVAIVHVVGGRPYLKTTAWVAGIILMPLTFGASLIPAVGMTGLKKNGYYISVEYKDDVDLGHAVNFRVKGTALQLKVKGDIENKAYRYRKALKEGKSPEAQTVMEAPAEGQATTEVKPPAEVADSAPAHSEVVPSSTPEANKQD